MPTVFGSAMLTVSLTLGALAHATGRLPSFLWLGICRPCAVSPPLILGAFALATGRLPSFLWLGICRPCAVSPPLTLGALALVWLGFADRLRFFPQKTETV